MLLYPKVYNNMHLLIINFKIFSLVKENIKRQLLKLTAMRTMTVGPCRYVIKDEDIVHSFMKMKEKKRETVRFLSVVREEN